MHVFDQCCKLSVQCKHCGKQRLHGFTVHVDVWMFCHHTRGEEVRDNGSLL